MKKEMNKFGQITLFIIIAVIIVGAIGVSLFVFKKGTSFDNQFSSDPQIQAKFVEIRTSVLDCMKFTSEEAVKYVGFQGGYYKAPSGSYDLGFVSIPYFYNLGKYSIPDNSEIQRQLGLFVTDNLKDCLKEINISDFKLSYDLIKTNTEIKKDQIKFNIDMPITIARELKTVKLELKNDPILVNSKLYDMIDVSRYYTDSHKQDPNFVCVSCLTQMAQEKEMYIDMINMNNEGTIVLVAISEINPEDISYPLRFNFMNKYPTREVKSSI